MFLVKVKFVALVDQRCRWWGKMSEKIQVQSLDYYVGQLILVEYVT